MYISKIVMDWAPGQTNEAVGSITEEVRGTGDTLTYGSCKNGK